MVLFFIDNAFCPASHPVIDCQTVEMLNQTLDKRTNCLDFDLVSFSLVRNLDNEDHD